MVMSTGDPADQRRTAPEATPPAVPDSAAFRALHRPGEPLLLPTTWDYAFGALLATEGFTALGTTSLGVAATDGHADGHASSRERTIRLAHRLSGLGVLVSVDIADGFGGCPQQVADLAETLTESAVGLNIEDGRPGGVLATIDAQCSLISAIKARVPGMFVNARVDTHWLTAEPPLLRETIHRANAYTEAGADGVFVPGLDDAEAIASLVRLTTAPLNILLKPGGHTIPELAKLGVARVSLGSVPYRAALHGALEVVRSAGRGDPVGVRRPSYADITSLLPAAEPVTDL